MRATFYSYHVERIFDRARFQFDLRPFLRSFCAMNDAVFKSRFLHSGEHLYLLNLVGDQFIFLTTRDQDILKRIHSRTLVLSDLQALLAQNESIGMASYVVLGRSSFAFASTVLGPKAQRFSAFMNELFLAIGLNAWTFVGTALTSEVSREEVLKQQFIGKSYIRINHQSSKFQEFLRWMRANPEDFKEVAALEITLRPFPRQNIAAASKQVASMIEDQGLEQMTFRAKSELNDHMVDLYVLGQGAIAKPLRSKEEANVFAQLTTQLGENPEVTEKVREHEADDPVYRAVPEEFSRLGDVGAWPDIIRDLRADD